MNKWEVVVEVGVAFDGTPIMDPFIDGLFKLRSRAVMSLRRECVRFEPDGTPYTELKRNEDGVWQWMTGEDRSYGHDYLHNDKFIHIREVVALPPKAGYSSRFKDVNYHGDSLPVSQK